jgi:hypothetical protein
MKFALNRSELHQKVRNFRLKETRNEPQINLIVPLYETISEFFGIFEVD